MVLLDVIAGFDRVIVVDAIMTDDFKPRRLRVRADPGRFGGIAFALCVSRARPENHHRAGEKTGYKMPAIVEIHAIKIEENTLFTEYLTPPVEKALPIVAERLIEVLSALNPS